MVRAGTKRKAAVPASKENSPVVAVKVNGNHDVVPPAKRKKPEAMAAAAGAKKAKATVATVKKAKVVSEAPPRPEMRLPVALRSGCCALTVGQGDTGQLGLGEDVMERAKPAVVKALQDVVDICAGGMHSICLNKDGEVFTFGCNDEGALGRQTDDDDECYAPEKVALLLHKDEKVVQISAGDSHSVVLTSNGRVFYWGTFRDSSGSFGLTENGIEKLPIPLCPTQDVKKVASGADHVAILTQKGELYTLGCAEQGQLGRVGERFVARGGRRGIGLLHVADRVHAKNRKIVFTDVWAGSYSTYAQTADHDVLVCGLNNYNQLGLDKGNVYFTLVKSASFSDLARESSGIKCVAPGQHHALVLDKRGQAYAIGRVEYGRLGLGAQEKEDAKVPTTIAALKEEKIVDVSCGTAVSFAVAESGAVYSWGMGTNGQLAHEDDDDAWTPTKMMGKQLEERNVVLAAGGGQHTMLLARNKN